MKRILLLCVLCASVVNGFGQSGPAWMIAAQSAPAGGGSSCSLFVEQTTRDYELSCYNDSSIWQGITNTTDNTITICKVDFLGLQQIGTANTYFAFYTSTNRGGSQVGGFSKTNSVSSATPEWQTGFTFTDKPTIAAHSVLWLTARPIEDVRLLWSATSGNPYGGTSMHIGSGVGPGFSDYDAAFKLYTE